MERFKQKDLLMELLEEMMGEFPALSRVFVSERDVFLANSLRVCSQPMSHPMYGGKSRNQYSLVHTFRKSECFTNFDLTNL